MTHMQPIALPEPAMAELRPRASVTIPLGPDGVPAEFMGFDGFEDGHEHVAIRFAGRHPEAGKPPLVRLHSECLTGDIFASARCDCGAQLQEAIGQLAEEGGILLYLRQEGRGIGLYAKLDAYRLQDQGIDTFTANRWLNLPEDGRNYTIGARMLQALGITAIRLLTNNPDKVAQLEAAGVTVAEVRRTGVYVTAANRAYLAAKARHRHTIDPLALLLAEAPAAAKKG
ncbi:GTP cyclohydrolase II [Acidisoma sp. C75]